jgi:hypothetical protein
MGSPVYHPTAHSVDPATLCAPVNVVITLSLSGDCSCPATGEFPGFPLVLQEGLLALYIGRRCDLDIRAPIHTLQLDTHTTGGPDWCLDCFFPPPVS